MFSARSDVRVAEYLYEPNIEMGEVSGAFAPQIVTYLEESVLASDRDLRRGSPAEPCGFELPWCQRQQRAVRSGTVELRRSPSSVTAGIIR